MRADAHAGIEGFHRLNGRIPQARLKRLADREEHAVDVMAAEYFKGSVGIPGIRRFACQAGRRAVVERQQELAIVQVPTRQFVVVEGLDFAVALGEDRRQTKQFVEIASLKPDGIIEPRPVARWNPGAGKCLGRVPQIVRIDIGGTKGLAGHATARGHHIVLGQPLPQPVPQPLD